MQCPACGCEAEMLTFTGAGEFCPKCKSAAEFIKAYDAERPTQQSLELFYHMHTVLCRTIGITDPKAIEAEWIKETNTPPPVSRN